MSTTQKDGETPYYPHPEDDCWSVRRRGSEDPIRSDMPHDTATMMAIDLSLAYFEGEKSGIKRAVQMLHEGK